MRISFNRIFRNADMDDNGGGFSDDSAPNPDANDNIIEMPQDEEALNAMSPEDLALLEKQMYADGPDDDDGDDDDDDDEERDPNPDGEPPEDEDNEPTDGDDGEESSDLDDTDLFNIPKEVEEQTPSVVLERMDKLKEQIGELGRYADPEIRNAFDILLDDPVIRERADVLAGNKEDVVKSVDELFTMDSVKQLDLDFETDADYSMQKLSGLVQEVAKSVEKTVRAEFQQKELLQERNRKIDVELETIQKLDKRLESDLEMSDPKHPMADFIKFCFEEQKQGSFDFVKIGGKNAYRMYLEKKGELDSFDKTIEKRTRQKTQDSFRNAKRKAASNIPRGRSKSQENHTFKGIDVSRFKRDESYAMKMMDRHQHDSEMLKKMESWTT